MSCCPFGVSLASRSNSSLRQRRRATVNTPLWRRMTPCHLSVARFIGFVQTAYLRDEIVEYSDRVFDPMTTAAVNGRFEAVIDQLQPKQWCAINIGLRIPKHADLVAADRGERNRRFWTVPRNGRESAVGSRNFQFSQRPFERVAVSQRSKSPKAKRKRRM
jgi:hypothetical protein